MSKHVKGNLILLSTAIIWGAAFFCQSITTEYMNAYNVLFLRSVIGILALAPVVIYSLRKDKKENKNYKTKDVIFGGLLCGSFLTLASLFQQIGIETTSAGKAGFITSLYIVLVPIIALIFKKKAGINVYISLGIALIGLFFLSMDFNDLGNFKIGDLYILIGAFFFSLQIITIDFYSKKVNCFLFTQIQLVVQGIFSFVVGGIVNGFGTLTNVNFNAESVLAILYIGVMSSAVAYTLQAIGQKNTDPTVASLIMSLESVFGAIFAAVLYIFYKFTDVNQFMSTQEIFGAIIVFIAVILSQLDFKILKEKFVKKSVEKEDI